MNFALGIDRTQFYDNDKKGKKIRIPLNLNNINSILIILGLNQYMDSRLFVLIKI